MKFKLDYSKFDAYTRFLVDRQIPFAAARALTWTARDAMNHLRDTLPTKYTIRSPWTHKGIRMEAARKNNLRSAVYFMDEYMLKQEDKATLTPHGRHLAIPASSRGRGDVSAVRNTRGRIKRGMYPGELLDKPQQYFKGTIKGTMGIWKRTGRKDAKGWPRPHINLMYLLVPRGKIHKGWGFGDDVEKIAEKNMEINFNRSLGQALQD